MELFLEVWALCHYLFSPTPSHLMNSSLPVPEPQIKYLKRKGAKYMWYLLSFYKLIVSWGLGGFFCNLILRISFLECVHFYFQNLFNNLKASFQKKKKHLSNTKDFAGPRQNCEVDQTSLSPFSLLKYLAVSDVSLGIWYSPFLK